ncbi:MAG: hypothetical protein SF029_14265 [bacterium]|nr:hypothetical protein [bacterium]
MLLVLPSSPTAAQWPQPGFYLNSTPNNDDIHNGSYNSAPVLPQPEVTPTRALSLPTAIAPTVQPRMIVPPGMEDGTHTPYCSPEYRFWGYCN